MVHRPTGGILGGPVGETPGVPWGQPKDISGVPPGVLPEVPSGGSPWGTHGIAPVVPLALTRHHYGWFAVLFYVFMLSDSLSLYVKTFGPVCYCFLVSPGILLGSPGDIKLSSSLLLDVTSLGSRSFLLFAITSLSLDVKTFGPNFYFFVCSDI